MIENFLKKYKSKDIVYPSAVSRSLGIKLKDVYLELENLVKTGVVKKLYIISCPFCGTTASSERYYSISDIDTEFEIGCIHCDREFIPDLEKMWLLFMRKCKKGDINV